MSAEAEVPSGLLRLVSPRRQRDDSRSVLLRVSDDPEHRGLHRQLRVTLGVRPDDPMRCADILLIWRLPNDIYLQPAEVAVSYSLNLKSSTPCLLGRSRASSSRIYRGSAWRRFAYTAQRTKPT